MPTSNACYSRHVTIMFRTILAAIVLAVFTLLVGLPVLCIAWITGVAGPLYVAAAIGLRLAFAAAGVRVRAEGEGNIPAGPCLFLPNHTSALDPLALLIAVPKRIAFLAKEELFRIPFLGLAMRRAHFISVDRASREAAASSASRAVSRLRQGVSLVIYPEGTRSPDGRLLPFKRGAFLIAIRAGRPVVPVTILGAETVLPKGSRWIHPGEILIRFHPAIDVSGYRDDQRELLLKQVRAAITSALSPLALHSRSWPYLARPPKLPRRPLEALLRLSQGCDQLMPSRMACTTAPVRAAPSIPYRL